MSVIVLVDGEHYPPVVRDAIAGLEQHVVGAVFCGGSEKVELHALDEAYGIPVIRAADPADALREALVRFAPAEVLDMTDEPVLSAADRFRLATIVLASGATYTGADFAFRPPTFADVGPKPTVSIFATGKRTGKTAVASALARHATTRGHRPAIVAVGRGGPNPPEVIEAGTHLDAERLLELVQEGRHASSDYIEDALTSGVTTIGCRRVGGGLAGATVMSNMVEGARIAQARDEDLVILEGSGASVPEVRSDAGIIVVPATIDRDILLGYLNPYRLLLAHLAVVTMAEQAPIADATSVAIHAAAPELDIVPVVFRPEPLADVTGREAFFCTTAPQHAGGVLREDLERTHGCHVVGISHRLADRDGLRADLAAARGAGVLLVELKAAAVDVVVRFAHDAGIEVVFVNNRLVGQDEGRVDEAFDRILALVSPG